MANPIVLASRISEKISGIVSEMNFWHRYFKQDSIRYFEQAHERLAETYTQSAYYHLFGIAGGAVQMASPLVPQYKDIFAGAGVVGPQAANMLGQFTQSTQSLANLEAALYKEMMDESNRHISQEDQTLAKAQSISNSIIESLARTFQGQVTTR